MQNFALIWPCDDKPCFLNNLILQSHCDWIHTSTVGGILSGYCIIITVSTIRLHYITLVFRRKTGWHVSNSLERELLAYYWSRFFIPVCFSFSNNRWFGLWITHFTEQLFFVPSVKQKLLTLTNNVFKNHQNNKLMTIKVTCLAVKPIIHSIVFQCHKVNSGVLTCKVQIGYKCKIYITT